MNRKILLIGFAVLLAAVGLTVTVIGPVEAVRNPGTLEMARIAGDKAKVIELKGRELSLICISNTEGCAELISRAEKNPRLKSILLKAKTMDVRIIPASYALSSIGYVGECYVTINIRRSDEEIIAFLAKAP
jgi:hypothetical protein